MLVRTGRDPAADATAWLIYGEGDYVKALEAMSAAADAEDRSEKHPVTPGVPKPARELYGVMLLARDKPAEALMAFEATMKKEPNRLGTYSGAAGAALKAGDMTKAKQYYAKVNAIADGGDDTRIEIAQARNWLTQNQ